MQHVSKRCFNVYSCNEFSLFPFNFFFHDNYLISESFTGRQSLDVLVTVSM